MLVIFVHVELNVRCRGCLEISVEPIYHSLVPELYAGLFVHRVRFTNNLVETISRSDVSKDGNFNFVDCS